VLKGGISPHLIVPTISKNPSASINFRLEICYASCRFSWLVRVHVSSKVDFLVEIFRTDVAFERFESLVLPAMRDEIGRLTERFSTEVASMRLLSGMRVRVLAHIRLLVEPFATEVARIWAYVGMDHHMRGQRGRPFKRFAADLAGVEAILSFANRVGEEGWCGTGWVSAVHHLVSRELLLHGCV